MVTNEANIAEVQSRPQVSLRIIFTSYFIVGLTAFGMAILQKLKALVMDNRLVERRRNERRAGDGATVPRPADGGFHCLRGLQTARRDGRNFGNDRIYPAFFCFDVGSFGVLLCRWQPALGASALFGAGGAGGGRPAQRHAGDGRTQYSTAHAGRHHAAGVCRPAVQAQRRFDCAGRAGAGCVAHPPDSGAGKMPGRANPAKDRTRLRETLGWLSGR